MKRFSFVNKFRNSKLYVYMFLNFIFSLLYFSSPNENLVYAVLLFFSCIAILIVVRKEIKRLNGSLSSLEVDKDLIQFEFHDPKIERQSFRLDELTFLVSEESVEVQNHEDKRLVCVIKKDNIKYKEDWPLLLNSIDWKNK